MLRVSNKSVARCISQIRFLHHGGLQLAAVKFAMPAMSPTMEKGGIVDWKVKEGDEFAAGDVLLEVETDKAQIDVEAQDDGIVGKILVQNGAKDIPVGQTIAFLAEPGDDIKTLEYPSEDAASTPPTKQPEQQNEQVKKSEEKKDTNKTNTSAGAAKGAVFVKANPKQTLFPSVLGLLSANNISAEDALAQIQATGPNGRLLKGDVLAHLGKISKEATGAIASYYNAGEHLDLSNIKAQPFKEEKPVAEPVEAPKPAKPEPRILGQTFDLTPIINLCNDTLGKVQPFTVHDFVYQASQKAETFALQKHPVKSDYYDELFEDIVAIPSNVNRFKITIHINYSETPTFKASKPSIFDLLTQSHEQPQPVAPTVNVELLINEKVADADEKAQLYFKKLEEYLSLV